MANAGDFLLIGVVAVGGIAALYIFRDKLTGLFGGGSDSATPGVFDLFGNILGSAGGKRINYNCNEDSPGIFRWSSSTCDNGVSFGIGGSCNNAQANYEAKCKDDSLGGGGGVFDTKCTGVVCPTAHTHPIWVSAAGRCSCAWDAGYGPSGAGATTGYKVNANCDRLTGGQYRWHSSACANGNTTGVSSCQSCGGDAAGCTQAMNNYLSNCKLGGLTPAAYPCKNTRGDAAQTCCFEHYGQPGTGYRYSLDTQGRCTRVSNIAPKPAANPTPCKGLGSGALACCNSHYGTAKSGYHWSLNSNGACVLNPNASTPPCKGKTGSAATSCCNSTYGSPRQGYRWSLDSAGKCVPVQITATPSHGPCYGTGSGALACCNRTYGTARAGTRWSLTSGGYCNNVALHTYRKSYASQRSTGVSDYYYNRRNRVRQRMGYAGQRSTGVFDYYDYRNIDEQRKHDAFASQRSTGQFDYYDYGPKQVARQRQRNAFASQRSTGTYNFYYNRNKGGAVDLVNNVNFSGIGGLGG